MIKAHVYDNLNAMGVNIAVVLADAADYSPVQAVLRLDEHGYSHFEFVGEGEQLTVSTPTMTINHEVARALLDALLRFYEGASDMHTVRADLLDERKRVDKLLATVCSIAEQV